MTRFPEPAVAEEVVVAPALEAAEAEVAAPVAAEAVVVVRWNERLGSGASKGSRKPKETVMARGKVMPKEREMGSVRVTHR